MKTIICLWGTEQIGKTSAINTIFSKLNLANTPEIWRDKTNGSNDFHAELDFCGSKVGLVSPGDPGSAQKGFIEASIKSNCEVIICASRTKGGTVTDVEDLAKANGYKLIWTSPFSCPDVDHTLLNDLFAEAVITLIKKCLGY